MRAPGRTGWQSSAGAAATRHSSRVPHGHDLDRADVDIRLVEAIEYTAVGARFVHLVRELATPKNGEYGQRNLSIFLRRIVRCSSPTARLEAAALVFT
jgi:hypothetical protein